jgi:hypothetical protein
LREHFETIINELGGIILTPDRWTGLDRIPPAGPEWLSGLILQLEQMPLPAGVFDSQISNKWSMYWPEAPNQIQKDRWQKRTEEQKGQLWGAWHEMGWAVYAWTGGGSPSQQEFIRLNGDGACRTMFSLDRKFEMPIPISVNSKNSYVEVEIRAFLPKAEYRFLTTLGDRIEASGKLSNFRFDLEVWPEVDLILSDRLGLISKRNKAGMS